MNGYPGDMKKDPAVAARALIGEVPNRESNRLEKGMVIKCDLSGPTLEHYPEFFGNKPLVHFEVGGNPDADIPPTSVLVVKANGNDAQYAHFCEMAEVSPEDGQLLALVLDKQKEKVISGTVLSEIDYPNSPTKKLPAKIFANMIGSDGTLRWVSVGYGGQIGGQTPFDGDQSFPAKAMIINSNGQSLFFKGATNVPITFESNSAELVR